MKRLLSRVIAVHCSLVALLLPAETEKAEKGVVGGMRTEGSTFGLNMGKVDVKGGKPDAKPAKPVVDPDEVMKQVDTLPLDYKSVALVREASSNLARRDRSDVAGQHRLWDRFIAKRAELKPREYQMVLVKMWEFAGTDPAEIESVWQEALKADPKTGGGQIRGRYVAYLEKKGEWEKAFELRREDDANPKAFFKAKWLYAQTAYRAGRPDEALAAANSCTNEKFTAGEKTDIALFRTMLTAKTPEEFLAKTPGDFDSLRYACRFLYRMSDGSPEKKPFIRALVKASFDLQWPEEKVEYTATYVEDAPSTAEGALRAGLFDGDRFKRENRFGKFDVWTWMGGGNESASRKKEYPRLRTEPKPDLAANAAGKEGALVVCCDSRGVHFYVKLNDPEAWKTRAGLADGLYYESVVQTGDEDSWHWQMISALKPVNELALDWDSPQFGRRMTADGLKTDVYTGRDCYAVHLFVPWLMAYDRLPTAKGDFWRYVMVVGWAGQFGSLGGSGMQELGRGMKLFFDVDEKAVREIRLGTLRAAIGEYVRFRAKWENADFWADRDLGDPEYYAAVVKPYLDRLDRAAKEEDASFLADFADTRLKLDEKRSAWLRARLAR